MTDILLETQIVELRWNRNKRSAFPMRMVVNPLISISAGATKVDGIAVLASFSQTPKAGEFDITFATSAQKLRPLLGKISLHQNEYIEILDRLAEGLDILHGRDIIHGFLRAETLLMNPKLDVFIPDWFLQWSQAPLTELNFQLPQISPEFLRGDVLNPATDQFLLACIGYRLLYGVYPFHAANRLEQLLRIDCGVWASTPPIEMDIGICDVWDRAFSVKPEWRFSSCTSFVEALRTAFSRSVSANDHGFSKLDARAESRQALSRGTPIIWGIIGLFALMAIGLSGWSSKLARELNGQVSQFETARSEKSPGRSVQLRNGILKVCNPAVSPLNITALAVIYRDGENVQKFNSTEHLNLAWSVAPASQRSLSFAEGQRILWDGSVLFYYMGYQKGQNYFVATGLWDADNAPCLGLPTE